MKKWMYFVKIKFHLNDMNAFWIKLIQLNSNSCSIKLNSNSILKNEMQIGGEDIVKYVCKYGAETKTFKKTQIQKYTFLCLFILEWAKKILVWNCPNNDIWNLTLSYLNQLQWIIFIRILILVYNMDIVFSCQCRSWPGERRGVIIKEMRKVVHEKVLK